jgi:hypothetical protein
MRLGPRFSVDTVEERKMTCPCQESNPGYPFVVFHCTDRAITVHFNEAVSDIQKIGRIYLLMSNMLSSSANKQSE